ncbi:MAG: NAD(P)/FAD-dependent oxidoreductase [Ardenticatenales bacterium]
MSERMRDVGGVAAASSNAPSGRRPSVAIIGAGFAGLSAAWDLAGAGWAVTVFDGAPKAGGLASGFRDDRWEWPLEHYYHHLFQTDRAILGLAEEIGFARSLLTLRPVSASFFRGRAYPLDGVVPILTFPGMPLVDRIRMGVVGLYLKLRKDWRPLERVTAESWVRRWMGDRAYRAIWEPLLLGKFGPQHYRAVPMSWLWARLHARSFKLIYVAGGFQAYADALVHAVEGRGAAVRLGTPVRAVRRTDDGLAVATDAGEDVFDRVIATTAPHVLARLAPDLPADYTADLARLQHLGAVVFVLALKQPLMTDGTYWLNLDKREMPFLACVEHTNLIDPDHYGGDHLVYLGDYLPTDDPAFDAAPDALLASWLPALERINPAFRPDWVRTHWLSRVRYAQPVVPCDFSSQIPPLATPIAGLYLASMSQVYPWDRGTNFAVDIGRRVAAEVMAPPA